MNRVLVISFVFLIGSATSCKHSEKSINRLETARKYYDALHGSNSIEIRALIADSIVIAIPEYNYEVQFSRNDYVEKWLKWDSVFEPTYKILEIELENEIVKAKVSKSDKRIHFLMREPFLTNEVLSFQNDKISGVKTEYLNFNESTWEKKQN